MHTCCVCSLSIAPELASLKHFANSSRRCIECLYSVSRIAILAKPVTPSALSILASNFKAFLPAIFRANPLADVGCRRRPADKKQADRYISRFEYDGAQLVEANRVIPGAAWPRLRSGRCCGLIKYIELTLVQIGFADNADAKVSHSSSLVAASSAFNCVATASCASALAFACASA